VDVRFRDAISVVRLPGDSLAEWGGGAPEGVRYTGTVASLMTNRLSRYGCSVREQRTARRHTCTLRGPHELTESELSRWRELADRAAEPNPFFLPEYVLAATHAGVEQAVLLVVDDGERWVCCLPVRRGRRWRTLTLPCLKPWLPDYAFLSTPLIAEDALEAGAQALAEAISACPVAFVVLNMLDPDDAVGRALSERLQGAVVHRDVVRAALRRSPAPDADAWLNSRRAKRLRKLRRRLERDLHGEVVVRDRAGDPSGPELFLDLERQGWKGHERTALASRPADAEFFRRMCASMAATGRLQLLSLECGDRIAAMQCNLLEGDTAFTFKVAHDPSLARHSPGVVLELESIRIFHELSGIDLVDSCAEPGNELINRLWPDRRRMQTLVVPGGRAGASLVPALLRCDLAATNVLRAARRMRSA
jgi:CelD/BcsL family acetyltransferase involved in cellulose biosynthesis